MLARAGCGLGDVVRLNIYTTDVDQFLGAFDVIAGWLDDAAWSFPAHYWASAISGYRSSWPRSKPRQ